MDNDDDARKTDGVSECDVFDGGKKVTLCE
jgi:hypothetical protein